MTDCRKARVTAGELAERLLQWSRWELMEACPGEVVVETENLLGTEGGGYPRVDSQVLNLKI